MSVALFSGRRVSNWRGDISSLFFLFTELKQKSRDKRRKTKGIVHDPTLNCNTLEGLLDVPIKEESEESVEC